MPWRTIGATAAVGLQVLALALLVAAVSLGGGGPILRQWMEFALQALAVAIGLWPADGWATLLTVLSYLAKLALALAPVAMLIARAPMWCIGALIYAAFTVVISVAFVRACASVTEWIALCLASAAAVLLVRLPLFRWAVVLPAIVLLVIPARRHNWMWEDSNLAARCAANDGQRPANVDPAQFAQVYYGVHVFPPDWILLTGQRADEGRFLGMPHSGRGAWWLRKTPGGGLVFHGPSSVSGNIWTSCLLGDEGWLVRAGWLLQVRPPGADGWETVRRIPFEMIGFDAPDTACDERSGTVFASDLGDGRLIELSPRTGRRAQRRPDALSSRGGLLSMRRLDGRLVMLDFQDLVVYAPHESRLLHRTPAAIVSSSMSVCQADGAVAVADLAGRLRVFRMTADGGYELDWGLPLFAPRTAKFSPDCAFLAVASANDRDVWVIERATRRIVERFQLGPAVRGVAFVGPREFVVADACTVTLLHF